jgi:hypothetical protein
MIDKNKAQALSLEIQTNAFKSVQDDVRAQIARGLPDHGMPQDRHIALVALVAVEALASAVIPHGFANDGESAEDAQSRFDRWTLQQAFAGSMLNPSALRQDLEGKGKREIILKASSKLESQYGV